MITHNKNSTTEVPCFNPINDNEAKTALREIERLIVYMYKSLIVILQSGNQESLNEHIASLLPCFYQFCFSLYFRFFEGCCKKT